MLFCKFRCFVFDRSWIFLVMVCRNFALHFSRNWQHFWQKIKKNDSNNLQDYEKRVYFESETSFLFRDKTIYVYHNYTISNYIVLRTYLQSCKIPVKYHKLLNFNWKIFYSYLILCKYSSEFLSDYHRCLKKRFRCHVKWNVVEF